ncbi:MAG TPA: CBS domain-containing protein [Nitrospiraceae bacterium]|nr:CBS domain-containing protein [Nitrospiraceae bacterium]
MDLIVTHLNADFDGLASMVAARKLYPGATLVLPGGTQETVRSFLAVHDLGIARLKELDLDKVTRLILVDTHEPERLGPLKNLCIKPEVVIHVYDHHPDSDTQGAALPLHAELRVLEAVGATATILIEQLRDRQSSLTPFEATVLAIGLYEETGSLAYASTTPRDLEAAAFVLQAGADLNVVSDTLRRHLDPEQITLLNDLLKAGETYYLDGLKVLVASSAYDRYCGDLADLVQKLAEMEAVDAVVVAVAMEDKVEIIGRSRRPEIDVGRIAQAFGGGGHAEAAAASVKGRTLVEVTEQLRRLLTEEHRPTLLARDVMTKPVKSIGEEATITEAERTMTMYGVNVLPVLDGRERYQGLITRELVQKALFHKLAESSVREFLLTDQYQAGPDTPFRDIEAHMIERNQRFVPIVSGIKVIGVVTRTDLLRALHDDVLAAARARIKGVEPQPALHRRNVRSLMMERLPARAFILLETAGRLADHLNVQAYVVGGIVRDLLLGIGNLDLDLVIEGDGIVFARELAKQVGGHVKAHERFGTAIVIMPDGVKLDVATARTEYYEYPTALPTVEQGSIKKDLYRRDFTINTLAVSLNGRRFGELIDFYGGQRDLKDRTIRVLHSLSFVEDPTRVFRAIRFEQRFGFHLGKETLALIKGAVKMDLFHRLSGHRLLNELMLVFADQEPRRAVTRMAELGLLRFIHQALKWSPRLDGLLKAVEDAVRWYRLLYLERKLDAWLVYFMALMEVLPSRAVGETVKRLGMPARDAERIKAGHVVANAVLRRLARRSPPKPSETYHALSGLADETLLLLMAKARPDSVKRQVSVYLTAYQRTKPSLTGTDLKALGLKPGPQFKRILGRLLDARLDGDVKSEADERVLVKKLVRV